MPNAAYRRPWGGAANVVRVIQKAECTAVFRPAWALAGSSRIPLRFIQATVAIPPYAGWAAAAPEIWKKVLASDDLREGLAAFAERRKPGWRNT